MNPLTGAKQAQQLRFFGRRSIVRRRPAALGAALLARAGLIEAVAVWPGVDTPTVALDLRDRTVEAWAAAHLPSRARALHLGARTWQALRAGSVVRADGPSVVLRAAEEASAARWIAAGCRCSRRAGA